MSLQTSIFKRTIFGIMLLIWPNFSYAQAPATPGGQQNLAQFLTDFANGGGGLVSRTRDTLIADKATLAGLIGLLTPANQTQREAIAGGLAQAAKAYATTDQAFATQIQQAVAATGLADVILAYASVAGETGTAATGGGGGGGGGGGPTTAGTTTTGSSGGATAFGNNSTPNASANLLTGGSVGSASFSQVSPF
jgi:hypothetical protein